MKRGRATTVTAPKARDGGTGEANARPATLDEGVVGAQGHPARRQLDREADLGVLDAAVGKGVALHLGDRPALFDERAQDRPQPGEEAHDDRDPQEGEARRADPGGPCAARPLPPRRAAGEGAGTDGERPASAGCPAGRPRVAARRRGGPTPVPPPARATAQARGRRPGPPPWRRRVRERARPASRPPGRRRGPCRAPPTRARPPATRASPGAGGPRGSSSRGSPGRSPGTGFRPEGAAR